MTVRKQLSARAVEKGAEAEYLNRELVPVVRQLMAGTIIDGSVGSDTPDVLKQLLEALDAMGVIRDRTTA